MRLVNGSPAFLVPRASARPRFHALCILDRAPLPIEDDRANAESCNSIEQIDGNRRSEVFESRFALHGIEFRDSVVFKVGVVLVRGGRHFLEVVTYVFPRLETGLNE
jgi:hypothetical protein